MSLEMAVKSVPGLSQFLNWEWRGDADRYTVETSLEDQYGLISGTICNLWTGEQQMMCHCVGVLTKRGN